MGCGLSRNAQVVPYPSETWRSQRPCTSAEFPTLLPHQVAYNLAVSNPPPPPYSREPLAGHYSVIHPDDLFRIESRISELERPASRRERRRSETLETSVDLSSEPQFAPAEGFPDPSHSSTVQSTAYHWRGRSNAVAPRSEQTDIYHSTPIPSMTDLGHIAPSHIPEELNPSSSVRPSTPVAPVRPASSSQSMPLASMPVILGSQELPLMDASELSRPSSRQSQISSHASFPSHTPYSTPRVGSEVDIPPLVPRQQSSSLLFPTTYSPQTNEVNPTPAQQGPPPPLRSIFACRTPPLSGNTVASSPPVVLASESSNRQPNSSSTRIQRSITFPRMVTPKAPIRLPPIHSSHPLPVHSANTRAIESESRASPATEPNNEGSPSENIPTSSVAPRSLSGRQERTAVQPETKPIVPATQESEQGLSSADVLAVPLT